MGNLCFGAELNGNKENENVKEIIENKQKK